MRLMEFYSILNESNKWTIEHESNGTGRLLAWEEDYSSTDDIDGELGMSYEMIAHGNLDKMLLSLPPNIQAHKQEIYEAWEDAIATGDSIQIISDGDSHHIDMVPKKRDDDSSYDSNEDELY